MKIVLVLALIFCTTPKQSIAFRGRVGDTEHFGLNPNDQELLAAPPLGGSEINTSAWKVVCDSEESGNECRKAVDGDQSSFWHTSYSTAGEPRPPHSITVDLGAEYNVNGISVLPRQDGNPNGFIAKHDVSVSMDALRWDPVASGTWHGDMTEKLANFEVKKARHVRLTALSEFNDQPWTSVADLKVFESPTGPSTYNGLGYWGPTINFPTVPVAAALEPLSGKVLIWSAYAFDTYQGSSNDRVFTATWDPASGSVVPEIVDTTQHDMFCPGVSVDGTGKMVVTGGNTAEKTTIYDFASGDWITAPDMNIARGYQSSAVCSDGRVFTIGGSWSGGEFEKPGEIYSPKTRSWARLPGARVGPMLTNDDQGIYRSDNHAWLFGWKNGAVFQAGPSTAMNWYYTSGSGGVQAAGIRESDRGRDSDSMCGNAIMYDASKGKILAVGGSPSYQYSYATANAHVITIGEPGRAANVNYASNGMWYARAFHNSVILPNGNVFITGGQSYAVPFSDDTAQLTPEIYDVERDLFYKQQPNSIPRVYHSVALLLADGRVFVGGGGLCGNCETNHFDAQIFTPQYLLNSDGSYAPRPIIKSASKQGGQITISTDSKVGKASLIRYGTSTHAVNTDQRRIALSLRVIGTNQYAVDIPTDPGILVPGYYMLFVLNENGVPSIAKTLSFLTS